MYPRSSTSTKTSHPSTCPTKCSGDCALQYWRHYHPATTETTSSSRHFYLIIYFVFVCVVHFNFFVMCKSFYFTDSFNNTFYSPAGEISGISLKNSVGLSKYDLFDLAPMGRTTLLKAYFFFVSLFLFLLKPAFRPIHWLTTLPPTSRGVGARNKLNSSKGDFATQSFGNGRRP